jgi:tetratricopeptide (TPR) repeat protein
VSRKLQENTNTEKVLRKCNAQMLLYGSVKRRNIQGKEMHLLNVEGMVRHSPIPVEISKRFADDFGNAIPRKLMLTTESDALIFESASAWFDLSARYVIGVAAYLSGAVAYAERMLLQVEESLKSLKSAPPFLQSIAKKLPVRFMELYTNWQNAVHDAYDMTGNIELLKFQEQLNDKLLARDPKNYSACLGKSIAEFVLRRNVQKAKEYVRRTNNSKDATWLYNLAFLLCYEGDLQNSHEEYRKAFRKPTENIIAPIQCEEFIQKILLAEPDKHQLYFALGLINYNAKKDYASARNDFSAFLKSDWAAKYLNEKNLSEKLLQRCNDRLREKG